jgi:pimeloyl-[acyl-carrier protein] methyl ester esterase
VPILYIRAKRDRLVGMASLDEIRQIRPETDVVVVDGPHLLFQREPQWTGEIVVEFVSALG